MSTNVHSPARIVGNHHPQRAGQFARARPGLGFVVAVGLIDGDDVGSFEDAAFDPLQLVAGAGEGQEQEGVDHVGDGDLGLPDPDRLDDDNVESACLAHQHGFPSGTGHPAEMISRR